MFFFCDFGTKESVSVFGSSLSLLSLLRRGLVRTGASLFALDSEGDPTTHPTPPPTLAKVVDNILKVSTHAAVTVFSLSFSYAIFQANRTLAHPHCTFSCFVVALLLLVFHAACFVFSFLCSTASSTASSDSSEDLIREFCRSPSFLARDCNAILDSHYGGLRTNEVCLVGSLFSLALLCVLFVCLCGHTLAKKQCFPERLTNFGFLSSWFSFA